MIRSVKELFRSFRYAGRGIRYAVRGERNLRFHLVMAVYVLFFSRYFELSRGEYGLLFVVIGLVIAMELVNTAVERAVDVASLECHPLAAAAKDAAAAAVLVCAMAAVAVGVALFWEPEVLLGLLTRVGTSPVYGLLLLLSLVLAFLFIFAWPEKEGNSTPRKKSGR